MKKILFILLIFSLGITFIPQKAAAQTVGTFNCDLQPGKQRNATNQNEQIINNFLLNILTYADLGERLRCDPLIVGKRNDAGEAITTSVYRFSQNLVNTAVLLILIAIAFANILRIKLDTYAVKKSVPLLIFGVMMANISLPIIRTIVDFSGVITATFIGETSDVGTKSEFAKILVETVIKGGASTINQTIGNIDTAPGAFLGAPWGTILAAVGLTGFAGLAFGPFLFMIVVGSLAILLIPTILFLYFGLLFVARIYVLVILTAVSPLAFASLGFTPLKGKIWGWWWNKFISWTFMVPATFALMWISVQFYRGVGGSMDIGTYIVTIALLGIAAQIPFKMGGSWLQQWNKAVAQPFRDTLLAPFKAAQQDLPKRIDRRLSQPTTIPFTGGRYKIPPVNISRMNKEFRKVVDAKIAKEDANAPAGRFGRTLGNIYAGATLEKLPRVFSDYKTGRYRTPQDLEAAAHYADEISKQLGQNPIWDNSIDAQVAKRFLDSQEAALASGDTDKIIGAYLANAKIGRHDVDQEKYLKILRDKGLDTSFIRHSYEQTMRRSPVAVRTIAPDPTASPQQQAAALNEYMIGLRDDIAAQKNREETIELLKKMVDILSNIRKADGTKATSHEDFVKAIESNKALYGIASTLAQQIETLPVSITSLPVFANIEQEKERLAATKADQIIVNIDTIIDGYNTATGKSATKEDLKLAFTPGMTDPERIGNLPEDVRHLLRYLYDEGAEAIKDDYQEYLERRFENLNIPDYDRVENLFKEYIERIMHKGEHDTAAEDLNSDQIDAILTHVISDKDEREKVTASILQQMRDYSLHTQVYDNILGYLSKIS